MTLRKNQIGAIQLSNKNIIQYNINLFLKVLEFGLEKIFRRILCQLRSRSRNSC